MDGRGLELLVYNLWASPFVLFLDGALAVPLFLNGLECLGANSLRCRAGGAQAD